MSDVQTPRRRAKGIRRERLIVDAAAGAIAELGLSAVTISDIARRAEMSAGHVTYYFPSKSVLLMRAIRQSEERLHQAMTADLAHLDDPWQRLSRMIELSASSGRADSGWALWFEVWASAAKDPTVARFQSELDARWRASLTDIISDGCARGAFTTDDPDAVSMLLSCLIDGLSVHVTLGDEEIDLTRQQELCLHAAHALLGRGRDTRRQDDERI